MSRSDRIALALSLLAVLVAYFVTVRVFEKMAHIEDEMAYVWQAQAIARGTISVPIPVPESSNSFLVPFVVDYNHHRFGKYPLGWPIVLAVGVLTGLRDWVNPLLAGFGVWLTYSLGKRIFGELVGLLAAALTITSPFFLMNSGSLLSHPFGLVLSLAFVIAWLDAFAGTGGKLNPWLPALTAGLTLAVMALTRPLTAVAVALPFGLHGLYLLWRGPWETRRRVLAVGAIALILGSLHLVWQYAVTGDPFLNPYTLWWKYDTVGFGPGIGRSNGHTLHQAWINTRHSLRTGAADLFGWFNVSWIFLPFGLLAARRSLRALLAGSVIVSLLVIYLAYWIGSSLFGPRYYYEGLFSLTLFTAAGIAWLAGWPIRPQEPFRREVGKRMIRPLTVTAVVATLVFLNVYFYLPMRVGGMHGLYEISRARIEPFLTPQAQELTPALIIVHPRRWMHYGALLELSDPFLDTPFLFVISRGPERDALVSRAFPGRSVYHYYPDEPYTFFLRAKPQ